MYIFIIYLHNGNIVSFVHKLLTCEVAYICMHICSAVIIVVSCVVNFTENFEMNYNKTACDWRNCFGDTDSFSVKFDEVEICFIFWRARSSVIMGSEVGYPDTSRNMLH